MMMMMMRLNLQCFFDFVDLVGQMREFVEPLN